MLHKKIELYQNRKDVTLTTYIIQHSMEFLSETKRPAVLICPGGAYLTCADGEGEPVAMAFNAMGYHAFVLRYSTYMQGQPGIPMSGGEHQIKEHCIFPNPMLDIRRAMQEIIDHTEEWKVNAEQIVLCGFSAGAHNCGMYSVYWKKYQMPRPMAAILGYPVGDYRLQKWKDMQKSDLEMFHISNLAIAGMKEMDEEMLDKLSIIKNVSKDTPPMFLWNTSEDEMVPAKQALKIAVALSEAHIPFEIHTFENGPHGLSTANECSAVAWDQVSPQVEEWTKLAHSWLKKRLSVNLLEKIPF